MALHAEAPTLPSDNGESVVEAEFLCGVRPQHPGNLPFGSADEIGSIGSLQVQREGASAQAQPAEVGSPVAARGDTPQACDHCAPAVDRIQQSPARAPAEDGIQRARNDPHRQLDQQQRGDFPRAVQPRAPRRNVHSFSNSMSSSRPIVIATCVAGVGALS